jgi:hypothetical protein
VRSQRVGIFVSLVGGLGETAPYDLRTSACHRSRMKRLLSRMGLGQKFAWVRLCEGSLWWVLCMGHVRGRGDGVTEIARYGNRLRS